MGSMNIDSGSSNKRETHRREHSDHDKKISSEKSPEPEKKTDEAPKRKKTLEAQLSKSDFTPAPAPRTRSLNLDGHGKAPTAASAPKGPTFSAASLQASNAPVSAGTGQVSAYSIPPEGGSGLSASATQANKDAAELQKLPDERSRAEALNKFLTQHPDDKEYQAQIISNLKKNEQLNGVVAQTFLDDALGHDNRRLLAGALDAAREKGKLSDAELRSTQFQPGA